MLLAEGKKMTIFFIDNCYQKTVIFDKKAGDNSGRKTAVPNSLKTTNKM